MANKILITYQDFINYLEELARDHVDIGHGVNNQTAFTQFTKSNIERASRNSKLAVKHLFWGEPYIADGSTSPDNTLDDWIGDIYIFDRSTGVSQKFEKQSEAILILQEFRARFKQDSKILPSNWLKRLDLSSIKIHPAELPAHKLAGAGMAFRFAVASNTHVNPEKWLSQ